MSCKCSLQCELELIYLRYKFESRLCFDVVRVNLLVTVRMLGKLGRAQHKQKRANKNKNKIKEERI